MSVTTSLAVLAGLPITSSRASSGPGGMIDQMADDFGNVFGVNEVEATVGGDEANDADVVGDFGQSAGDVGVGFSFASPPKTSVGKTVVILGAIANSPNFSWQIYLVRT